MPLAIDVPAAYEANPGYLVGRTPAATTALTVLVDGRRYRTIARRARGTRFRIGPIGLPARDLTLTVRAERNGRVIGQATVRRVHGLPRTGLLARPARATDPGAQAALRRLGGGSRSAWLRHLGSGRAASWNAGATFPAASTLKLAILLASLARSSSDPVRGGSWSTYQRLVFDSSNRAANELLVRMGGSTSSGGHLVNAFVAGLGGRSTDMYGGYLLEPGERRLQASGPGSTGRRGRGAAVGVLRPLPVPAPAPAKSRRCLHPDGPLRRPAACEGERARPARPAGTRNAPTTTPRDHVDRRLQAETPPAGVDSQPGYPTGKHTSAHDLGALLVALVQAAGGRGPAPRLGLSPREARCALWLLLHARYAGLFAPASPFAVAHKAGWLPTVQHDASIVFTPSGPLVAVTMNYGSSGVSVGASQAYASQLLRIAAREL